MSHRRTCTNSFDSCIDFFLDRFHTDIFQMGSDSCIDFLIMLMCIQTTILHRGFTPCRKAFFYQRDLSPVM